MSDCALIGLVLLINLLAISFIFFSRHVENMNTKNMQIEHTKHTKKNTKYNTCVCESNSARRIASMLHLSSLLLITGIPFTQVITPALLWLAKKDEDNFIDYHGREVINFQISLVLIQLACAGIGLLMLYLVPNSFRQLILSFQYILSSITVIWYLPVNIFTILPFLLGIIFVIKGIRSAYCGFIFKYPCSYRFVKMHESKIDSEINNAQNTQTGNQQINKTKTKQQQKSDKQYQEKQINFGKFNIS